VSKVKVKNRFLVAMFVFSVAELIVVVFLIFVFPEVVFLFALPFPEPTMIAKSKRGNVQFCSVKTLSVNSSQMCLQCMHHK
jgi:uncharacterized protein (UPF0305 family)